MLLYPDSIVVFGLQIVNWSDPSWWQARKVNSKERPGLVPSQDLEERRKCFVKHNGLMNSSIISCCGTTVKLNGPITNPPQGGILTLIFCLQGRKEKSKYGYVVRKNLDFDRAV